MVGIKVEKNGYQNPNESNLQAWKPTLGYSEGGGFPFGTGFLNASGSFLIWMSLWG